VAGVRIALLPQVPEHLVGLAEVHVQRCQELRRAFGNVLCARERLEIPAQRLGRVRLEMHGCANDQNSLLN
jgi:hypothetical protein